MPDIEEVLETIASDLATLGGRDTKGARSGSRYVGSGADPAYARHVAAGGTADTWNGARGSPTITKGAGTERSGIDFLRDVKDARRGDPAANERLRSKAWLEGTGSAGGFFAHPELLPGYVEARRVDAWLDGYREGRP